VFLCASQVQLKHLSSRTHFGIEAVEKHDTHYVHYTFSVKEYGFQDKSNIAHIFLNFYTYRGLFMPLPPTLVCEYLQFYQKIMAG
jgi:hypothetical protein